MLSATLGHVLVGGLLAGIVLFAVGAYLARERKGIATLGVFLAIASAFAAIAYMTLATPVYVVRPGPAVEEHVLLLPTVHRLATGKQRTLDGDASGWLINESGQELALVRVVYGPQAAGGLGGRSRVAVNVMMQLDHDLDHIGPSDAPPDSVTTEGGIDTRTWLTW